MSAPNTTEKKVTISKAMMDLHFDNQIRKLIESELRRPDANIGAILTGIAWLKGER